MTDFDLPEFDPKAAKQKAISFATSVFGDALQRVTIADDGACRAIFKTGYFVLQGDNTEPSKSQWSTLKKKLKRHNKGVFVFKETGTTPCTENSDTECYYVDFGFFLY